MTSALSFSQEMVTGYFSVGVLIPRRILRASYRLPAVTVRTPTGQKADNRSVVRFRAIWQGASRVPSLGASRPLLSHYASIIYAYASLGEFSASSTNWGFSPSQASSHR